jgi:hypothetical protein
VADHGHGGPRQPAFVKRVTEVGLLDQAAAGRVEEERPGLHQFEPAPVDQPGGLGGQRAAQADDVGLGEDLVQFSPRERLVRRRLRPGLVLPLQRTLDRVSVCAVLVRCLVGGERPLPEQIYERVARALRGDDRHALRADGEPAMSVSATLGHAVAAADGSGGR